jgi:hypothetical protein
MKSKSILGTVLASAAMLASASAAPLKVDFNANNTEITQTDWEAFSSTTDPNNKTVAYSGYDDLAGAGNSVSITSAGIEYSRDAGVPNPTSGLDDMYRDLILRNDTTSFTLTISGLLAGDYYIRTYHHVETAAGSARSSFDIDAQDADSPSFGQSVGNFTMGGNGTPVDSGLFTVNSNGSDDIVLRFTRTASGGDGGRDWVGVNGVEITNVPEPDSLALLGGLGCLGLLARRRHA